MYTPLQYKVAANILEKYAFILHVYVRKEYNKLTGNQSLIQWRIRDLLHRRWGATREGFTNLLYGEIFDSNCMKMKEIGLKEGEGACP